MKKSSSDHFSRRAFLKGSGAAATALATGSAAVAAESDGVELVKGETTIRLNVNGQPRDVRVEPRTTLLEVLRSQLALTGAKPVSSDGTSGASTVLIDGRPSMASTTLAVAVAGKAIETIEGLGGDGPDEVSRAFVAHGAQQCGYCWPGFVVAVRAVLNKHTQ
ncbi:MAG: (2Fe-2S)-binding protein, partial [Pirellulales bacterium]